MAKTVCKILDGKVCVTTSVLAETLSIDSRTLQDWNERGCPKIARGWWAIKDVLVWRGLVDSGGVSTKEQAEKASFYQQKLEQEIRLKGHKAEEAEMKMAILKNEYIPKDEVTADLQRFFTILKKSLMGYSRRVATEIAGFVDPVTTRRIERMITELTNDALEQLSIDGVYKAPVKKKTKI